jgi:Fe-Mn family superoxide dismutase
VYVHLLNRHAAYNYLPALAQARQFHASIPASLHEVPNLIYKEEFEEKGIAGFLNPESYDIAYNKNMAFLVDRLNKATKGCYTIRTRHARSHL